MGQSAALDALTVSVLGGFATHRGHVLLHLRPSTRPLLALLAVGGRLTRADAGARLYPDLPGSRAMGNIRTVLWRLREDASGLIAESGDSLELDAAEVDYVRVQAWCHAALGRAADLPPMPANAAQQLLPTWDDLWLIEPREHLRALQVYALEAATERFVLSGRFGEAYNSALSAVAIDGLRESAVRMLIEISVRQGNHAEALRRFHAFEYTLLNETHTHPSAALITLMAPLLNDSPVHYAVSKQGAVRRRV